MSVAHTLYRGHKRLKPLIDFALRDGWDIARTPGGHLKFIKHGFPPIYTSARTTDHRAGRNAMAQLRPADRTADPWSTTREVGTDD